MALCYSWRLNRIKYLIQWNFGICARTTNARVFMHIVGHRESQNTYLSRTLPYSLSVLIHTRCQHICKERKLSNADDDMLDCVHGILLFRYKCNKQFRFVTKLSSFFNVLLAKWLEIVLLLLCIATNVF